MTRASLVSSRNISEAASADSRLRAARTAVRMRWPTSSDRVISAVASCSLRSRSRLAISLDGRGTPCATPHWATRPPRARSAREDDLHDVAADLAGDRFGQFTRRFRPEGSLHPPHPATTPGKLQDDLRRAGIPRKDHLDLLEERDGPVIVQDFPEADEEWRRLVPGRL